MLAKSSDSLEKSEQRTVWAREAHYADIRGVRALFLVVCGDFSVHFALVRPARNFNVYDRALQKAAFFSRAVFIEEPSLVQSFQTGGHLATQAREVKQNR